MTCGCRACRLATSDAKTSEVTAGVVYESGRRARDYDPGTPGFDKRRPEHIMAVERRTTGGETPDSFIFQETVGSTYSTG